LGVKGLKVTKLDTHRIALVSHEQRREKQHLAKNSRIQEIEVRKLKIVKKKRIACKNQFGLLPNNGKTLQRFTNFRVIFRLLYGFLNFGILGQWNYETLKHWNI